MSVMVNPERVALPLWAAKLVDGEAPERVLVLGSYPPSGRDLDVLARPAGREAIGAALARDGFIARGPGLAPARAWVQQWVRFSDGTAFAVDVHQPERYGLSDDCVAALFDDAVPIEGMKWLARCAPYHVLLITARGLARRGGRLSPKRRGRVERALADDPGAWTRARELAPAWGLSHALDALRRAFADDERAGRTARARAQLEIVRAAASRRSVDRLLRLAASRRPRPAQVVSVSGLDGAGKSSQTLTVQELLAGVGVEAVVAWMPLGHSPRHPTLRLMRRTAGRALRISRRLIAGGAHGGGGARPALGEPNPMRGARERSELITQGWVTIVALIQALQHRRAVVRHFGTGRLVIFDRYVLDSAAQLRYFYGAQHRFEFQKRLVRLISPTPKLSFLLDVPPETVAVRKPLQYSFEELCLQAGLYQDELRCSRVVRLDGERPQAELTDEIAEAIWREAGR
jgi:thymidylate kinase